MSRKKSGYNALTTDPEHWNSPLNVACPSCRRRKGQWCMNTITGLSTPNRIHRLRLKAAAKLKGRP